MSDFERERVRIELRALMLAEGKTSGLQSAIGRQLPESRQPTMGGPATVDAVRDILRDPRLSRAERLRLAREICDLEQFGPPDRGAETPEQFAYRVLTQYVNIQTAEVARREAARIDVIARIRRDNRQDSRGRPLPPIGGNYLESTSGTAVA